MKRAAFIVLCAIFISALIIITALLAGCADNDIPKGTEPADGENAPETEIGIFPDVPKGDGTSIRVENAPIKVEYVSNDIESGYRDHLERDTVLIKSTEELTAYYNKTETEDTNPYGADKYDEEFFRDNYLVIYFEFAYSGSLERWVRDITFTEDPRSLYIYIDEYAPVCFTDDCGGWTHYIEIDRIFEVESVEKINIIKHIIEPFSYVDDMYYLGDDTSSLKTEGFKNTDKVSISTEDEAIRRAKNELSDRPYERHYAAYDCYNDMWRVTFCFTPEDTPGDSVSIYLGSDGRTVAILFGE